MSLQVSGIQMGVITGGPSSLNLYDLADVSIVSPQNGQYLRYNDSISEWQNTFIDTDVYNFLTTNVSASNGVSAIFTPGPNLLDISLTLTASGDAAGSVTSGNLPLTLATVNVSPQADTFRKITVNNKGLTTATSPVTFSDITTSLGYTPVNVAGDTMTGALILNNDPVLPYEAATKRYVDNIAEGLKAKPAAEVATTTNLVSVYDNGVQGVGATLTSTTNGAFPEIDGVTVATTTQGQNGILVKNQSDPAYNGRYNLTQVGDGLSPWILTRCGVCDTATEIPSAYVFVKAGTQAAGTGWVAVVANPSTFEVGVDDINWIQFSGEGTYIAGTGIDITSNVISNTGVVGVIGGTNISVSALTGTVTIDVIGTVASSASLAGGSAGALVYQSAPDTTVFLSAGTTSQVLIGGASAPSWSSAPVILGTNFTGVPNGALVNSSVTIGSTNIALGGTSTTLAGLTSVTSTTFNSTSTSRVKDAIVDLSEEYLYKFSMLRPREYNRKDYSAHEFGFVAEEMILVYPEVVTVDPDGAPTGIDYGKLSTILTAKVQEQQKVIDVLREQMDSVLALLKKDN